MDDGPTTKIVNLPLELLANLATRYLTSPLDQLSFLISSPKHLQAFLICSSSSDKWVFSHHFQLAAAAADVVSSSSGENITAVAKTLVEIYDGLGRLSNDGSCAATKFTRYHYSIDRRRGYLKSNAGLDDTKIRLTNSRRSRSSLEWIRDQVTNSTFAFALNGNNGDFVLVHTLNGKQSATVTKWPQCKTFYLSFEVMGQDLLLHRGHLILMPLLKKKRATTPGNLILAVYNVEDEENYDDFGKQTSKFYWKASRAAPQVYKESGEARLYVFDDKLVQILPTSNIWTVLIYRIAPSSDFNLELIKAIPMPWVEPSVIGQLFCADQKGPHFVFAFISERLKLDTYSLKVATLDLNHTDPSLKITSIPEKHSSVVNLQLPVAQLQLFLLAVTDFRLDDEDNVYRMNHSASKKTRSSSSSLSSILLVYLFPDGNLATTNSLCSSLPIMPKYKHLIDPFLWHYNELAVKDKRIFVMLKLGNNFGRIAYATDLHLNHLWTVELDCPQSSRLHLDQRLYLHASHGLVWLSDANGCSLFHQDTGCEFGYLPYPAYVRELPELESTHEDTSPYAQTGFSIWGIHCLLANRLLIVHDIERCSPVIVDVLDLFAV
jgi:hypothetical protein